MGNVTKNNRSSIWFALVFVSITMLSGMALPSSRMQAAPLALPTRPEPLSTLQPEPTPKPVGGWIELRAWTIYGPDIWSVVQWQDSLGVWRDVEEWRGTFDEVVEGSGRKTWWVDQKDFGASFRWIVYRGSNGTVLGQSQPFYAPTANRQIVAVEVSLAPF